MQVILYRRAESGVTYYYTLDDRQQSLFGTYTLTLSWGTNPEGGRKKFLTFNSVDERAKAVRRILKQKTREYKVLYTWFKNQQEMNSAMDTDENKLNHHA